MAAANSDNDFVRDFAREADRAISFASDLATDAKTKDIYSKIRFWLFDKIFRLLNRSNTETAKFHRNLVNKLIESITRTVEKHGDAYKKESPIEHGPQDPAWIYNHKDEFDAEELIKVEPDFEVLPRKTVNAMPREEFELYNRKLVESLREQNTLEMLWLISYGDYFLNVDNKEDALELLAMVEYHCEAEQYMFRHYQREILEGRMEIKDAMERAMDLML